MRVEVYDAKTFELIGYENAEPTHDDLCNRCNECLLCCGGQRCYAAIRENDPPYKHQWVREVEPTPSLRSGAMSGEADA